MSTKDRLTNEKLNKFFESPFSLVNYAIQQAKHKIARGDVRSANAAIEVLMLLEKEGIQEGSTSEESKHVVTPPVQEKKREGKISSGMRKDPSAYTWSDMK